MPTRSTGVSCAYSQAIAELLPVSNVARWTNTIGEVMAASREEYLRAFQLVEEKGQAAWRTLNEQCDRAIDRADVSEMRSLARVAELVADLTRRREDRSEH